MTVCYHHQCVCVKLDGQLCLGMFNSFPDGDQSVLLDGDHGVSKMGDHGR